MNPTPKEPNRFASQTGKDVGEKTQQPQGEIGGQAALGKLDPVFGLLGFFDTYGNLDAEALKKVDDDVTGRAAVARYHNMGYNPESGPQE